MYSTFENCRTLVGWNDTSCNRYKQTTDFWHKILEDAGCPSFGVLFQIKIHTKTRYKYEVCPLKRRQNVLLQDKLASLFANKKRIIFGLKSVNLIILILVNFRLLLMGVSGNMMIANLFASSSTQDSFYSSIQASVKSCHLNGVLFSVDEVLAALSIKSKKSDDDGLYSKHLKLASPSTAKPLAIFITSIVRHGHMPQCLSDCVFTPIPKGNKDPS